MLNPDRLHIVGSVLTRYSEHLAPGHRVRVGLMEGDPCAVYRSASDAPCATVTEVKRDDDGTMRFEARVDDSDTVFKGNNYSFASRDLWEIEPTPDSLEKFAKTVQSYKGLVEIDEDEEPHAHEGEHAASTSAINYRAVTDQLSELERTFKGEVEESRAFRATMASAVAALAGDVIRSANGNPIEFSHMYLDRYDADLTEQDTFRAGNSATTRTFKAVQAPTEAALSSLVSS